MGHRDRTPAERDHCGRHKIVIIAAGTMRQISFATALWKQDHWARRVRRSTLREVIDRCVLNRFTEIACKFIASWMWSLT
jgi:hypothetical protein